MFERWCVMDEETDHVKTVALICGSIEYVRVPHKVDKAGRNDWLLGFELNQAKHSSVFVYRRFGLRNVFSSILKEKKRKETSAYLFVVCEFRGMVSLKFGHETI